MLQLLIPAVVVVGCLWYFGIWPFDRSYASLTNYTDWRNKKTDVAVPPKE